MSDEVNKKKSDTKNAFFSYRDLGKIAWDLPARLFFILFVIF
jgi:hypothetical protein